MEVKFRLEAPEDYYAVEEMTRETFWTFWEEGENRTICDEHMLVHKLRDIDSFVPELNLVAEVDGKIVGHIIYTKSRIEAEDGETYETLTFGPLTVMPKYQSRGIGRALLRHSFEEAKRLGHRAVLIFGHPDYYTRVGFKYAADFGLTTPDGSTFDAFQVYLLYDGALDGIKGKYFIDPVYMQLTQEETLEFDKRFPPKAAHILTPIDVLLERLKPDAARELKKQGFKSLDVLKSLSEREISEMSGMDADSIEIIRATMREYKFPWGESKGIEETQQ